MKTMCRLLVLCTLWSLALLPTKGQVLNAGFSILNPMSPLNTCNAATDVTVATGVNTIQSMCSAWFTPTNGTPDYFYGCDAIPNTGPDYGVPINDYFPAGCNDAYDIYGTLPANQRAYAGIAIKDDANPNLRDREYITQQLGTPLQPGRVYNISFLVRSTTLNNRQLIQRIGCLLTTAAPTAANTSDGNNGTIIYAPIGSPAIGDYAEAYDAGGWESDDWHYVSINVLITGAAPRNFLTIGCFQEDIPDAEWITQPGGTGIAADGGDAYYVIDNAKVCSVCPLGVNAVKKSSSTPNQCCFDVTLLGDETIEDCSQAMSMQVVTPAGTKTVSGPFNVDEPFEVCVDRFTSGAVFFRLYDANNVLICQFSQELKCDCLCDDFVNPPDFKIKLVGAPSLPGTCCWDIVVDNATGTLNAGKGCDLKALGIIVTGAVPAAMPGYSYITVPNVPPGSPTSYLTKHNVPGGDTYMHGTSTIIGRICLPQGSVSMPISFQILKGFGPGGVPITCGAGIFTEATCANECCNEVLNAVLVPTSNPNTPPFTCCFRVDLILTPPPIPPAVRCITSIIVQSYDISTGWVNMLPNPVPVSGTSMSIPNLCTAAGVSKKIRLLFRNGTKVVCIKEFTLQCEADCCSKVKDMQAYRESPSTCCYRIHGYVNGPGPNCPSITHIDIEEYVSSSSSWVLRQAGAPTPDSHFDIPVCVTTNPAKIRILFRTSPNGPIVCTRWLTLNCNLIPPGTLGKTGSNNRPGMLDSKAWAVPNPATDETTIHYTLSEKTDVRITLFNSIGDIVAEISPSDVSVGEQATTISTTQLPSGMYYAQISTGGDIITLPITVVR